MTVIDQAFEEDKNGPLRAKLVAGAMAGVFVVISGQGAHMALSGGTLSAASQSPFESAVHRADIQDRNGELLATSVSVYSLFADPRAIWDANEVAYALSTVFPDLDVAAVADRLNRKDRSFVWLQRGLTPRQRQDVFALGLEGIGFREETRRMYPRGSLAGHVIGFTNVDGDGIAGIERGLDERLADGGDPVRLTIDSGVQFALEAELTSAASLYNAKGGAGVVMDAHSGDVLGLASWPPLDPNRPNQADPDFKTNRASGGVYELGSVFKPFTVAAGLEAGLLTLTDTFDVRRPIAVGTATFEDEHHKSRAASLTDIVAYSSNVGTVKIGLMVGAQRQRSFLADLGLTDRAPLSIPETARPLLPENWDDISTATVSFGHGIAVSPVAFASAFTAFANDGEIYKPNLVLDRSGSEPPKRVMSAPTANVLVGMMRETAVRGTGRSADIPGYRVAGKTGTAEKPVAGGYDDDRQITSFASVFPADDPKYVVFIVLDEPDNIEGGGETAAFNAAPTAGRVIERIAPLLDVIPRFEDISRNDELDLRTVADRRSL